MKLKSLFRGHGCPGLILILAILLIAADASAAFKYISVGMEAHEFSGKDLISGDKISIRDLHKDNLVIVVFWATWSPRSLEQLAEMNALKAEYADQPIQIVAVNVDAPKVSSAVMNKITETISELDLQIPVILDEGLKIFYSYGVIAVPSTAIIDTSGTLRYDPGGYGLMVREIIVDSVKVFLGLASESILDSLPKGYQPKRKSSRYYNLALNLKQTGMYDRALANLELASQADPLFATPYALRGEILLLRGEFDAADSAFRKAATLDSAGVSIWAGWGRTLLMAGDKEAAGEKLSYALRINDTYTPALIDYGLYLAGKGDLEAAIDSLSQAVALNHGDPMIHHYLGRVYRQAGRIEDATSAYMIALSIAYPAD